MLQNMDFPTFCMHCNVTFIFVCVCVCECHRSEQLFSLHKNVTSKICFPYRLPYFPYFWDNINAVAIECQLPLTPLPSFSQNGVLPWFLEGNHCSVVRKPASGTVGWIPEAAQTFTITFRCQTPVHTSSSSSLRVGRLYLSPHLLLVIFLNLQREKNKITPRKPGFLSQLGLGPHSLLFCIF